MLNLLESMLVEPGFSSNDKLLAVTTLAFDISIVELFLPLMTGGSIVVAEQYDLNRGESLAFLIKEYEVNFLQSTPATFRLLMDSSWAEDSVQGKSLKVLCCGEPLPKDLVAELIPRVSELWNMFGPTETTVYATRKRIKNIEEPITIGAPLENTQVYIVDSNLALVPQSIPGELCVAGENLAFGYHAQPDLSAEKFVEHPQFGRIYRTGDLAKWAENGEVIHLGRIDDQVKIRGYRVELGEIEKVIAGTNLVSKVVVFIKTESDLDTRIIACCIPVDGMSLQVNQIRDNIKNNLPSYMVPQHFVAVDKIPLTSSGKVDRKQLASVSWDFSSRVDGEGDTPQSGDEIYLAELWKRIVVIDEVFLNDNFFDIGGHSLLASKVVLTVIEDKGLEIPLQALISNTLAQLVNLYFGENAVIVSPENKGKKSWFSKVFRKS
jgi:acyl-CoA synthetase (AMP-forming)/AMP-acid ligase II